MRNHCTIQDVCNVVQGGRHGLSGKHFVDKGYPAFGAGGLNGYLASSEFEGPAVVLSSIGARCGKCFFAEGKWSSLANTQVILPDLERVDPRFLWYQLNDESRWLRRGTGQPYIRPADVKEHRIYCPPLPEQKRIAAILDKADELRRKRGSAIAKLNTLIQSIFLDMFGDPVTNPMGWPTKKLSKVGTLERGRSKHRPRNAPELLGGPYPLVQTGDIANSSGQITEYSQTYSELGLQQSRMWLAGTLCITIAANIAKTGILTFDACFPDSVVGFHPKESTRTEYVQQWLSFLRKNLEATAPESAQKNINLEILRKLTIPLPPISLQDEFVERFEVVLDRKRSFAEQAERLSELFTSIQQEVFS